MSAVFTSILASSLLLSQFCRLVCPSFFVFVWLYASVWPLPSVLILFPLFCTLVCLSLFVFVYICLSPMCLHFMPLPSMVIPFSFPGILVCLYVSAPCNITNILGMRDIQKHSYVNIKILCGKLYPLLDIPETLAIFGPLEHIGSSVVTCCLNTNFCSAPVVRYKVL